MADEFIRLLATTTDQLRGVPAEDLLEAQNAIGEGLRATWIWRPAIDGLALTRVPVDAVTEGAAAGIPLLAQHCVDECELYQLAVPDAASQADRVLENYFGTRGRDDLIGFFTDNRLHHDPVQARVDIMSAERYIIPTVAFHRPNTAPWARTPAARTRVAGRWSLVAISAYAVRSRGGTAGARSPSRRPRRSTSTGGRSR
ncbi:hypothetical protein ACFV3N_02330 [Streptomyces bauhiniae]|uniref:hypothetical protein n=1 Tax=Streptomyces bauhiniae TaxID=2340725 RepID=UPI003659DB04